MNENMFKCMFTTPKIYLHAENKGEKSSWNYSKTLKQPGQDKYK